MALETHRGRATLVVLLLVWIGQGCGLILQERHTTVRITTDPEGAQVRVAGQQLVSPAEIELPRRRSSNFVVRASIDGFSESCRLIRFRSNGLLVALDSLPLALGLAVDGIAGTWPGSLPESVHVPLLRDSGEDLERLPSDRDLLRYSRSGHDPCIWPRAVIPKPENQVALYLLKLASVEVDGRTLDAVQEEAADARSTYSTVDDPVQLHITPRLDVIDLRLVNDSPRSIKVMWDDAVFVDFDQTSNPIGRRIVDYGPIDSSTQSVIAPRTAIEKSVFSLSRTYEKTTAVQTTDMDCARSCDQLIFQCMAGYNCSGYRSRQPYTGKNWGLVVIAEQIGAGLCERRCVDQGRACFRGCGRVVEHSEGLAHLDIVPALVRKCSMAVADFERSAVEANDGTYGVLLPIEVGGKRREYMLRFEPVLFDFEENTDCATTGVR